MREVVGGKAVCTGYKIKNCPNDKTCRFYKPEGCMEWVRLGDTIYPFDGIDIDTKKAVEL